MTLMLSSWSLVPQLPNIIVPRQRLLTETPVRPSGRSCMTVLPVVGVLRSARQEPDRDRGGLGAGDGSDDRRSVAVVLGVVGLVDVGVAVRDRVGEGDVAFDDAGADSAGATRFGALEPGVVGAVGAAHVQVVAGADDPDGHVRA